MNDQSVHDKHEHLHDEIIALIMDNFEGLLSRKAADSMSADIINWMDNEGWLVEPPPCQKREHDTNALACDNLVAHPSHEYCQQHFD